MKFIGELTIISPEKVKIGWVHNMPFDVINGIKKQDGSLYTEAELSQIGMLVENIPEPVNIEGKVPSQMFINPHTREIYYEYKDKPKTTEEMMAEMQQQINLMLQMQLESEGIL